MKRKVTVNTEMFYKGALLVLYKRTKLLHVVSETPTVENMPEKRSISPSYIIKPLL